MLEPRALGERRHAGQRLEALVDLQRVGGDRHRPLAARAQPVGDGEGEGRLADAGRPEDRQHGRLGGGHWAGVSSRRVSVRIGCGLSPAPTRASRRSRRVSRRTRRWGAHAPTWSASSPPARTSRRPRRRSRASTRRWHRRSLVGCGAGGVVGGGREVERGTAVAVWAAALGEGRAEAFHLDVTQGPDALAVGGLPDLDDATAVVLLPDPYSFPTDLVLASWRAALRACRCSAASPARAPRRQRCPLPGRRAVRRRRRRPGLRRRRGDAVRLAGRGAGRPRADVTAAEGHVIRELAGRPALDMLREAIEGLDPPAGARGQRAAARDRDRRRQARVRAGRLPRARRHRRGPRGGHADRRRAGAAGTVVRLHARDAVSADRDLREALGLRREALGGGTPAGALVFTCNGRGEAMFGIPTTTP